MRASAAAAALILDCDGVIVESEELHRIAYNATWTAHELGFEWTRAEYAAMQNSVGGGKEKLKWYLDTAEAWPIDMHDEAIRTKFVADLHSDKTRRYVKRAMEGVPARRGVLRLIDEAFERDVVVAVASAASRPAVEAVLRGALGEERVGRLACILAGDDVERKKPYPDIYEKVVAIVDVPRDQCVVVEDSLVGVKAAVAAALKVVVTYTDYTVDQDFSEADAVYRHLGEVGDEVVVTIDELFR